MKLTFWGAARTVTGSMHEVAANGRRYLLDCGLYQGKRKDARAVNDNFPFAPPGIEAVVLSHAHTDHTGNLPTLVRHGYRGPIYCTPATADLCAAMLPDSAHIQEKDALFLAKRQSRRKSLGQDDESEIVQPLYSMADAERTLELFHSVRLHEEKEIGPGVRYTTVDAGHMLGSTCVVMEVEEGGNRPKPKTIRLGFSGDLGRLNLPIIRDPEPMPQVDYLILESTYGDRLHQQTEKVEDKLADAVVRVAARGGKIVAPAFAVGRTQQVVMLMHQLWQQGRIPDIPVFVDSPLATLVTEAFRKHPELYDEETKAFLANGDDPFWYPRLRYIKDVNESKALNDLRGPMMIVSSSGMAETGRVVHHLRNTIENPRNMVLITGFQAQDTLGRKLVDKQPEVSVFGEPMRLRAEVVKLNELSGHADQGEIMAWLKPQVAGLKKIFLVHGEPAQQDALARVIGQVYSVPVEIPVRGQSFLLE